MKPPKLIVLIAINIIVIVSISLWYSASKDNYRPPYFYMKALIFIPIIWAIISFVFSYANYPRKNIVQYFITGQSVSLIILGLLGIFYFYPNAKHFQKYANIDHNRNGGTIIESGIGVGNSDHSLYRKRALDSLEKTFTDKNSFRVVSTSIHTFFDTALNKDSQLITSILFSYYKVEDKKKTLVAKYLLSRNTFITDYVGVPTLASKEYEATYGRNYENLSDEEKEIEIISNMVDDSLKKKWHGDFKKSLRESRYKK